MSCGWGQIWVMPFYLMSEVGELKLSDSGFIGRLHTTIRRKDHSCSSSRSNMVATQYMILSLRSLTPAPTHQALQVEQRWLFSFYLSSHQSHTQPRPQSAASKSPKGLMHSDGKWMPQAESIYVHCGTPKLWTLGYVCMVGWLPIFACGSIDTNTSSLHPHWPKSKCYN